MELVALGLAIQALLPVLVGLVTKSSTSKTVKDLLLLALTGVNTVATSLGAGDVQLTALLVTAGVNYLVSVAAHYKLYKPLGVTEKAQRTLVRDSDGEEDVVEEYSEAAEEEYAATESGEAAAEEVHYTEETQV